MVTFVEIWALTNFYGTDPQKRAIYDRSGGDPESRFSGMSSGSSPGFATSPFGGGSFEGELSPEDLFNMFFGGGGPAFGGAFGGGPGKLPDCSATRILISAQCFPPVSDLGVSVQPAFIHHATDNKRGNKSQLLPVRYSPRFSPSSFSSHSLYSLPYRPFSQPRVYRIRGSHSSHPRGSTWRDRRIRFG
jgi:hypothetical protein